MGQFEKQTQGPRKKRKGFRGLVITLVAVIVFAALGLFYLGSEIGGTFRDSGSREVEIPQGASTQVVAQRLEEADVIGNTLVFRAYSKLVAAADGTYQYGTFTLDPSAGYAGIIAALQEMRDLRDTVVVTFPEGYNAYQMGAALAATGLPFTAEEFVAAAHTGLYDVSFMGEVAEDPLKMVRLDGFLFPDTYEFFVDAGAEDVVLKMLQNFERKVLTEERKQQIAASGYTLEDLVIFASIIQREAANVEEMYNVSSVFTNRMQPGSPFPQLESCTTDFYIRDYIQPLYGGNAPANLLSAYDTYGKVGFPVGAIANPGTDAIDAALSPSETPYYFFVTDIEYTHYYGITWQDHQNNIAKALAVNKRYGKDTL